MQMKTTVFNVCLSGDLQLPSVFKKCLNPGPRPVPRCLAGMMNYDPASGLGAEGGRRAIAGNAWGTQLYRKEPEK